MKGRNGRRHGMARRTWRWSKRILKMAIVLIIAYAVMWIVELLDWFHFGIPFPFGFGNSVIEAKIGDDKNDGSPHDSELTGTEAPTQHPTEMVTNLTDVQSTVIPMIATTVPLATGKPSLTEESVVAPNVPVYIIQNVTNTLLATSTPTGTSTVRVTNTPNVTSTVSVTNTPNVTSTISITNTPNVTSTISLTNTPNVTSTVSLTNTPTVASTIQVTSTPQQVTSKSTAEVVQKPIALATFTPTPEPITGEYFVYNVVLTKEKFEEILASSDDASEYTIENSILKLNTESKSTLMSVTIYKETFEKMYEERVFSIEIPYKKVSLLSIWQQLRETKTDRVELVWFVQDGEYKLKCVYKNNHFDWLYTLMSGERYEIIE